jgi:hypothetical protein
VMFEASVGFRDGHGLRCLPLNMCTHFPWLTHAGLWLCRFWSSYTNLSSIRSLRHYMDVSTSSTLPPNTNSVRH